MNMLLTRCPVNDESRRLAGLRLLVVEDDYLVATDLCTSLQRRGASIVGPAGNTRRGRELPGQQPLDCALLDINLSGHLTFDRAAEVHNRGIRIIFTSGYDCEFLPPQFRDLPCLQKPINETALVQLLCAGARSRGGI